MIDLLANNQYLDASILGASHLIVSHSILATTG